MYGQPFSRGVSPYEFLLRKMAVPPWSVSGAFEFLVSNCFWGVSPYKFLLRKVAVPPWSVSGAF